MTPEQLVQSMLRTWTDDALDVARTLVTPDATVWLASAPLDATSTLNPGRDMPAGRWFDLLQAVLDQIPDGLEVVVHRMAHSGGWVAAEVESRGALVDGRVYNMRYTFWFEVRDGLISHIRQYFDTEYGQQFFLRIADEGSAG